MIITEKDHWKNGFQSRARGKHKTLALSIASLGMIITLHRLHKIPKLYINFYKLIKE